MSNKHRMKIKLTAPVEHRGELEDAGTVLDVEEPTARYLIARKKATEVAASASQSTGKTAKPGKSGKKE